MNWGYIDTVTERAEKLGLKVFDTALPQPWVDEVYKITGVYPVGLFVWCYDRSRVFGEPWPLGKKGKELLTLLPKRLHGAKEE